MQVRFTSRPGHSAAGTHCTVGWLDPTACLGVLEKKILCPTRDLNPGVHNNL
jgi:hypothetical protein